MSTIIGIDLGTSTTEAAVGLDTSGNWVVGERARAQYLLSPENTAIEVKRKIGTDEEIKLGRQAYTPVKLSAKLLEYVRNYASEFLGEEVTVRSFRYRRILMKSRDRRLCEQEWKRACRWSVLSMSLQQRR